MSERYGLKRVPAAHASTERFEADGASLRRLPFFAALDAAMAGARAGDPVGAASASYVIWGGVAANLTLMLVDAATVFYSCHDIELLLVRDGRIDDDAQRVTRVTRALSSSERPLPQLGGLALASAMAGQTVEAWQWHRVCTRDGDLDWNNVIMRVEPTEDRIVVEAPAGTISEVCDGRRVLRMKAADDIQTVDQSGRRVYRNISKAIRYEQLAGLRDNGTVAQGLRRVHAAYVAGLGEDPIGKRTWLYRKSIAETAKRLAGASGLSSEDRAGFGRFVATAAADPTGFVSHPLLELVRPPHYEAEDDATDTYYGEFVAYQPRGAEKISRLYSLPRSG